jgi:large subunit ribosomal protein L18
VSVHRSAKYISLQLIDDRVGKTIVCVNSKNVEGKGKIEKAQFTGEALAKKAVESGVTAVVFDRSGYRYHGRVKAAADGLRAGGLDV